MNSPRLAGPLALLAALAPLAALAFLAVLPSLPTRPFPEAGAQAAPGTDIWVAHMAVGSAGVDLASVRRITARPGYDNQPGFSPDEGKVLYTAIDSTGQADIWAYDLATGGRSNLTATAPESEFSATVMPGGRRFSVVRVEADSTQRLWSFDMTGQNPELVLPSVQPVGYHAWLDDGHLALFVLGSPATLQLASVGDGPTRVVATDIGRSLHRIPGTGKVSFVQLGNATPGRIVEYDPQTGSRRELAPVLEENEFHAWAPDGTLLTARGSNLLRWAGEGANPKWEEIADLGTVGIRSISRLAVSPDGEWIAIVGGEGS
jgi:Tol biopolymer transport system component